MTNPLGKEFFEKKSALCRVPGSQTLGKEFFEKKMIFAEYLDGWHSSKNFSEKKIDLCRVPGWLALGKAATNGAPT